MVLDEPRNHLNFARAEAVEVLGIFDDKVRVLVVAGTVLLLVLAGVAMNGFVQKQFFPGSDRLEVIVSLWHPQGTSIAETGETVRAVEALLEAQPGVVNQVSYVGAGAPRFFISSNPEQPSPAFGKVVAVARDKRARDAIMAAVREQVTAGAFAHVGRLR